MEGPPSRQEDTELWWVRLKSVSCKVSPGVNASSPVASPPPALSGSRFPHLGSCGENQTKTKVCKVLSTMSGLW